MNKSEEIKNELSLLEKEKSGLKTMLISQVTLLGVMLLLLFTTDIRVVYAAGLLALIYNLFIMRPAKKRYLAHITKAECLFGVGAELKDCSYELKGSLPKDLPERAYLVSPREWPQEAVCRHSLKGLYDGAQVHISECSFAVKHGQAKTSQSFLGGSCITAELEKDSGLSLCLLSRDIDYVSDELPELECFCMESLPFASKKANEAAFAFSDGEDIPEWLEKRFMKLGSNGAKVLLSLQGRKLTILLIPRFYAAKHKVSDTVTAQTLGFNRLPEMPAALDIIRIIQRNAAL